MDDETTERFLRDGFVKLTGAFDEATARECAALLWAETGYDPDDPATWTRPVVRVHDMAQEPFVRAANTPVLHAAFDRLVGPGRWVARGSLGTFPLRFPHPEEPDDAGWHIEGSYLPDGARGFHANVRSRDRALLMLLLFTETGEADAPTRIRVGSHLDVPPVLNRYGEAGVSIFEIAAEVERVSAHRPVVRATGRPGDVYLCHPFLVHAAQPHHGTRPRFMAQPPLHPAVPCDPYRTDGPLSPVEAAIRTALALAASG
ncbi:phytanoyl-CoA dioxygenase family protein [Streptantibioticus cattleyicolor]|uniref:Phytanoyl-CoA dioxygenase n=1 Tax=Streptantibioticus cattleyicolor (strain ATCC 35852 / DSM 46488 / JCM 4925 / NBRC 14057 / NRRL 8057) TaxID=1003195 RepID=F8JJ70_STREN|nr:phytanoyl-CoA dioxygenase family protein [Streptantibioticus cattleyicolor]AEW98825.1 hypothetical protein SCATT_p06320 [Streptantibioticus cattleyicolor NRRL 8057 = DSM 46488]CCB72127.1 conserved protein of unknown function [Streptantibioticus cattleyicolor NRRL 8057 = DSM 46488]